MNITEQRNYLRAIHSELSTFQKVEHWKLYLDISLTGLILWSSLFTLSMTSHLILGLMLSGLIYTTMFRGVALIHEVVHFKSKVWGLETLFNTLIGFPLRVPVYTHTPHQYHHNPSTFATEKDPEYLYLKGSGLLTFFSPIAKGLVAPILLVVRFAIYPFVAIFLPENARRFVFKRLSTIVVNPGYVRPVKNPEELKTAFFQDLGCALMFASLLTLFFLDFLNIRFFLFGYFFSSLTAMVNIYRARVAHVYDNESNSPLEPLAALRDSVNVTGGPLTFLWAPIGLRYHALHHLSPQIPYYNLAKAHRHLLLRVSGEHPYVQTVIPTFLNGLMNYKNLLKADVQ